MGVYFHNMEMPTNCAQCPVNMEVCKKGYEYLLAHPELYDKRADDCPLVFVPKHGRLIDADIYEELIRNLGNWECRRENEIICNAIKFLYPHYAPTVIPASEEGNTKPSKEK